MRPSAPRKIALIAVLLAATLTGTGLWGKSRRRAGTEASSSCARMRRASLNRSKSFTPRSRSSLASATSSRSSWSRPAVLWNPSRMGSGAGSRRRWRSNARIRSRIAAWRRCRPLPIAGATDPAQGSSRPSANNAPGAPHVANAVPPDANVSPSDGGVDRRAESQRRIEGLEKELRELRDREQATQVNAKNLEQALDVEKRAGQNKLEALQSVLQNTRSATTQLRQELEETRRQNSELALQVSDLHARRDGSAPTGAQTRAVSAPEVAEASETKPTLVPHAPPKKPNPASPSVQAKKLEAASAERA